MPCRRLAAGCRLNSIMAARAISAPRRSPSPVPTSTSMPRITDADSAARKLVEITKGNRSRAGRICIEKVNVAFSNQGFVHGIQSWPRARGRGCTCPGRTYGSQLPMHESNCTAAVRPKKGI
jgi:hypothetical protein